MAHPLDGDDDDDDASLIGCGGGRWMAPGVCGQKKALNKGGSGQVVTSEMGEIRVSVPVELGGLAGTRNEVRVYMCLVEIRLCIAYHC